MKNSLPDNQKAVPTGKAQPSDWIKQKLLQQKRPQQIKPIQFRGTQHRG